MPSHRRYWDFIGTFQWQAVRDTILVLMTKLLKNKNNSKKLRQFMNLTNDVYTLVINMYTQKIILKLKNS